MINKKNSFLIILIALIGIGCSGTSSEPNNEANIDNINFPDDNAGLNLPEGFSAIKIADSLSAPRHLVVAENGDVYIALQREQNGGGVVALRDTNDDGLPDIKKFFGDHPGTGIALKDGYLYTSTTTEVYRYEMGDGLTPAGNGELLISGFPEQNQHAPKAFTLDDSDNLYINVGAPSNSCQEQDRSKESPGQDPCPLLERHAGIWKFSASQTGQTQQDDGTRYATGLRNVVGIDWNDGLYVTQHGRDNLYQNWSKYYTAEESAELPAETLYKVEEGDNFGWPFSYYDQRRDSIMLAPEYGGDGQTTIANSEYAGQFERPLVAFPGHWAPNGLVFYHASQFPEKYQDGAFIAFHGSWNRAPEPQEGYKITFVPSPFDSTGSDNYEDFATGFPNTDTPQPGSAEHRPAGLAVGPDGSLFVTDDSGGSVWRIFYTGEE